MNYWSRIDLHQHTDHDIDCTGRVYDNNYTHIDFFKWLEEEKVKLKAVTCHNNIEIASHIKHAIIAEMLGINYLVGVEIDYKFDELEFHAITILSPNADVFTFANKLKNIRTSKGNNIFFNKKDFCKLHENIEFIFIPHAIKDKGILEQKIGNLETSTIDWVIKTLISGIGEPILFENTRDYHIYSVIEKINKTLNLENVEVEIAAYVGDDYRFDNDESRKEKIRNRVKYCINSKPTYRGLELALRNSATRLSLETQIIERERFIKSIKINDNNVFDESDIDLSPGLNVIIGNSGSGKTLLLNQIYYEIKGENLKAAIKNKTNTKDNQYKSKVGNNNFLEIEFDQDITNSDLKILEIPNIYSEILKFQDDDTNEIPKMFGIDDITNSNLIISDYKRKINEYFNNLNLQIISLKKGEQNTINIKSAIEFLQKNKNNIGIFKLNKNVYNTNELENLTKKILELEKYISDYEKIKKYFEKLKEIITKEDGKSAVDNLLKSYELVIESLKYEYGIKKKKEKELTFDKIITEKINGSIDKSIKLLGNKEKTIKEREQILSKEAKELIQNIKDEIVSCLKKQDFNLSFPYEKLKLELEKNCNEYARLTLNVQEDELKNTIILESNLFDCTSMKKKLSKIGTKKFNLLNDKEVKNIIMELNDLEINFSNLILDANEMPKNVELYLNDKKEWKFIQNINKGDIAKKSLEYYFNKLVIDNQPDVILIDQPENDVDKTFISNTLSSFIKNQKIDKQIIVTSHDAIIAINSDVNKIIEAIVTDDNKIKYESYDLEYVEQEKLIATNKVAKILDGGKNNIKIRYQIYGGELNYENRNI